MGRPRPPSRRWRNSSAAFSSKRKVRATTAKLRSVPSPALGDDPAGENSPRRFSTGGIGGPDAAPMEHVCNRWERRSPRAADGLSWNPTRTPGEIEAGETREAPASLGRDASPARKERLKDDIIPALDGSTFRSRSLPTRLERRRATWHNAREPGPNTSTSCFFMPSDVTASTQAAPVPASLQLQWEVQGVSGRAYQKDGNLALYRKKKMAARRRLSKHEGVRTAIEAGWWPYLPVRWIVLNDTEVLQAYKRLFASMYSTFVPTARQEEAEETAAWEYTGDASGLPPELSRLGITLGAFSDALFAVADKWTETVRAKDYIEFLNVLWERVRPDLLFPPLVPPRPIEKSPDPFSANTPQPPGKVRRSSSRRGPNRSNRDGLSSSVELTPPTGAAGSASAKEVDALREDGRAGASGASLASTPNVEPSIGRITPRGAKPLTGRDRPLSTPVTGKPGEAFSRPPPPVPVPPPRSPEDLPTVHVVGFKPKEAQRATWVCKRGVMSGGVGQAPAKNSAVGLDGGRRGGVEANEEDLGRNKKRKRARRRPLVAGVGERKPRAGGATSSASVRHKKEQEEEEKERLWDFAARKFPLDPHEGDAFLLFVRRTQPHLYTNEKDTRLHSPDDRGHRPKSSRGPVIVRRYHSEVEVWSRTRGKVPTRVLEDILMAWTKKEGLSPAEYGALRLGPSQRAGFLAYAIANGWGTRAGGVHPSHILEGVAKQWRKGVGRCPEMLVLGDLLEELLWEEANESLDGAFFDGVDLHSIPHRLLRDSPHGSGRCERQPYRASTAPAAMPSARGTVPLPPSDGTRERRNTSGEGLGRQVSIVRTGGGGFGAASARRVLLRGERIAGSVRQGQAVYYECACPTEKGACLEVTLVSEGERNTATNDETPSAISLYAVQACTRPPRLSAYPWVSRGKVCHRLLLNWKGSSSNRMNPSPDSTSTACYPSQPPQPAPIHIAVVCPEPAPPQATAFEDAVDLSVDDGRGETNAADELGNRRKASMPVGRPEGLEAGLVMRRRVKFSVGVRVVGPPRVVLEGRWYSLPWGNSLGPGTQSKGPLALYATLRLPTPLTVTQWGPGSDRRRDFQEMGEDSVQSSGSARGEPVGVQEAASFVDTEVLVTLQLRPSNPSERVDVYCDSSRRPGPNPANHTWWMPAGGAQRQETRTPPPNSSAITEAAAAAAAAATATVGTRDPSNLGNNTAEKRYSGHDQHEVPVQALSMTRARGSWTSGDDEAPGKAGRNGYPRVSGGTKNLDAQHQVSSGNNRRNSQGTNNAGVEAGSDNSPSRSQTKQPRRQQAEGESGKPQEFQQGSPAAAAWVSGSSTAMVGETDENGWAPLPDRGAADIGGAGWSRMTVAMPRNHDGAFHVSVLGGDHGGVTTEGGGRRAGAAIDIKAAVWCPAVTIPPRIPLKGCLPRGQRRELLWTIERGNPFFEARVEITRAIEDPFVLRQLDFLQNFQRRFLAGGDDGRRVLVAGSGQACQSMHTRPFLLASRGYSPSQGEYSWRGVNIDGTVEVLRSRDGTERVSTRYTETLKVGPRDGAFGIGRYRLALEAGATDCSFRLLFWNRSATAEDRTMSSRPLSIPAPATPRTIAIERWHTLPGGEEAPHQGECGRGGKGVPQTLEDRTSSHVVSQSSASPTRSKGPRWKIQQATEIFIPVEASTKISSKAAKPRTDPARVVEAIGGNPEASVNSSAAVTAPRASITNPTARNNVEIPFGWHSSCGSLQGTLPVGDASLLTPSQIQSRAHSLAAMFGQEDIRSGTAAHSVRSDTKRTRWSSQIANGCRRQLAIATQYLNNSLFSPTPPKLTIEVQPATAKTEVARTHRGFAPGGCCVGGRPRTTEPGASRRPQLRDEVVWHSSSVGMSQDDMTPLSSRPLSAAPLAGVDSPRQVYSPKPRRPRGPVVLASPRRELEAAALKVKLTKSSSGGRPMCGKILDAQRSCSRHDARSATGSTGVGSFGEVGYTISSPCGGVADEREAAGRCGLREPQRAAPSSEHVALSTPTVVRQGSTVVTVPKLPLHPLVHGEDYALQSPSRDEHNGIYLDESPPKNFKQRQLADSNHERRPQSAPPLRFSTPACNNEKKQFESRTSIGVEESVSGNFSIFLYGTSTNHIAQMPQETSSVTDRKRHVEGAQADFSAVRRRPQSARAQRRRCERAGRDPAEIASGFGGCTTSNKNNRSVVTWQMEDGPFGFKHPERRGEGETEVGGRPQAKVQGAFGFLAEKLLADADAPVLASAGSANSPTQQTSRLLPRRPFSARSRQHYTCRTVARRERGVTPREFDEWAGRVAARGDKWMFPTRDEVVMWGRDIDRLLKERTKRAEGESMLTVNGRERFVESGAGGTGKQSS